MELLETRHAPSAIIIVGNMIDQSADPGIVENYTLEPPPGVDGGEALFANLPRNHEFTATLDDKYFIAFGQDGILKVTDVSGQGWTFDFDTQEWLALSQPAAPQHAGVPDAVIADALQHMDFANPLHVGGA